MRLPEYRVELMPVNAESENSRKFSKYCWEELGKRFKIGGVPNFIQSKEIPLCPHCNKEMSFYAQLDAIGENYDIGDSGLIYVFYCFDCNEVYSFVQSY